MRISGLIIAAGFSGRMNSFKPILKIKDRTFIQLITEKLLSVCDDILIVTGYKSAALENVIEKSVRINFVYNENYSKGMFTSLKKGVIELLNSDWIIYHFADQPSLPHSFYSEFVNQTNENYNWIQPAYNSAKGHPILFSKSLYPLILNEGDNGSLRNVSTRNQIRKLIWDCNYPQILDDVDKPEDFERLLLREGNNL
ncbi:MAG: NTP transferase domain-containing protein [Bacteroidota bacterium]